MLGVQGEDVVGGFEFGYCYEADLTWGEGVSMVRGRGICEGVDCTFRPLRTLSMRCVTCWMFSMSCLAREGSMRISSFELSSVASSDMVFL